MYSSVLYVSTMRPELAQDQNYVHNIVVQARSLNRENGITGALAATEEHFAQFFEGPAETVRELLERIERDARHRDVRVVEKAESAEREFPDWSMAYSGAAGFVASRIAPLAAGGLTNVHRVRLVRELLHILRCFGKQQ